MALFKLQDQKSSTLCWYYINVLLTVCWCSVDALLTLHWHTVDAQFQDIVAMLSLELSQRNAAHSAIMGWSHRMALGLSKMQCQESLMLRWRSFSGWSNECVTCVFGYTADQSIYFARMQQCRPLIAEYVRLTIMDGPLTLTLNTSKQSS